MEAAKAPVIKSATKKMSATVPPYRQLTKAVTSTRLQNATEKGFMELLMEFAPRLRLGRPYPTSPA